MGNQVVVPFLFHCGCSPPSRRTRKVSNYKDGVYSPLGADPFFSLEEFQPEWSVPTTCSVYTVQLTLNARLCVYGDIEDLGWIL
ncbi:hypothetical protein BaRGS_00023852 [Batillaria attramentaria]|uniref:Uncharacterized protein n=1 Tax=Batillaria attramentaria TaxID=370345 RepID=A0ABD0KD10_9CAEN